MQSEFVRRNNSGEISMTTQCYDGAGVSGLGVVAADPGAFRFLSLGGAPFVVPGGFDPKPSRLRVDIGNLVLHSLRFSSETLPRCSPALTGTSSTLAKASRRLQIAQ